MFGVYRKPDLSDKFFYCLLTAKAKVQFVSRKVPFLFTGPVNAHHEEWLGSSTTNLHGRTARDFAPLSGSEQMITEPTHNNGGMLDSVLTDGPNVVGGELARQLEPLIMVSFS